MIEQRETLSADQRIASLRQFFRSRRADALASGMGRDGRDAFAPTQWPETEWSDTHFDAPFIENA